MVKFLCSYTTLCEIMQNNWICNRVLIWLFLVGDSGDLEMVSWRQGWRPLLSTFFVAEYKTFIWAPREAQNIAKFADIKYLVETNILISWV